MRRYVPARAFSSTEGIIQIWLAILENDPIICNDEPGSALGLQQQSEPGCEGHIVCPFDDQTHDEFELAQGYCHDCCLPLRWLACCNSLTVMYMDLVLGVYSKASLQQDSCSHQWPLGKFPHMANFAVDT